MSAPHDRQHHDAGDATIFQCVQERDEGGAFGHLRWAHEKHLVDPIQGRLKRFRSFEGEMNPILLWIVVLALCCHFDRVSTVAKAHRQG